MGVNLVPTVIYANMMGMTIFALVFALLKPKHRQTHFLIVIFSLLLVHILGELLIYSGAYQYLPSLAGAQFPVRMLLGPALYFYAAASMMPDGKISKRAYAIAATGPCLVLLAMAPFVLGLNAEQKLALADPLTRNPEHFKLALMSCSLAMLLFVLFNGGYLFAAFKLHKTHRAQLMMRFSDLEKRSLDWLKVLLILWGGTWLMFAVEYMMVFMGWFWFGTRLVLPITEALVLMAFAYLALNQPVLSEADKIDTCQPSVREAALDTHTMAGIAEKLNNAMAVQQLFLEDDLSLKRLSEAIAVSENHISETLSQYLKTNFFHYINGFRIEEAKHQLLTSEALVSTIAFAVGFNSKSTFNTAFKKSTGSTPTAFRKHQPIKAA